MDTENVAMLYSVWYTFLSQISLDYVEFTMAQPDYDYHFLNNLFTHVTLNT